MEIEPLNKAPLDCNPGAFYSLESRGLRHRISLAGFCCGRRLPRRRRLDLCFRTSADGPRGLSVAKRGLSEAICGLSAAKRGLSVSKCGFSVSTRFPEPRVQRRCTPSGLAERHPWPTWVISGNAGRILLSHALFQYGKMMISHIRPNMESSGSISKA